MAYDVDVQISLTVKGFPPLKSTIKPKNITDANSKSVTFTNDGKTCLVKLARPTIKDPNNTETRKMYCKQFQLSDACDIAFVAIKAKSYKYKSCPSGDVSGIGFQLLKDKLTLSQDTPNGTAIVNQDGVGCVDAAGIVWIDSDYIAVDFCAKICETLPGDRTKWIAIFLDPALFECNPNPAATLDVNVAYGLVGGKGQADEPASCCASNTPVRQMGQRSFQNQMV